MKTMKAPRFLIGFRFWLVCVCLFPRVGGMAQDVERAAAPTRSECLETEIFRVGQQDPEVVELRTAGATLALKRPLTAGGQTIEDFILQSGISWPEASRIAYNHNTNALVVTTTPTNMVLVRELIALWGQPAPRIEIGVSFVEIVRTRWFENSFQEGLPSPCIFTQKAKGRPALPAEGRSPESELGSEKLTRVPPESAPGETGGADTDQILSLKGIMTEPEFLFICHALDQDDSSPLLPALKVTTVSGREVQAEAEITRENWEDRAFRANVKLTPTVSADGKIIALSAFVEVEVLRKEGTGDAAPDAKPVVVKTRNIATTVHLNHGETAILSAPLKAAEPDDSAILVLLTARILRPPRPSDDRANKDAT